MAVRLLHVLVFECFGSSESVCQFLVLVHYGRSLKRRGKEVCFFKYDLVRVGSVYFRGWLKNLVVVMDLS